MRELHVRMTGARGDRDKDFSYTQNSTGTCSAFPDDDTHFAG